MDFWKTVLVLVRRWYVALPVFLLSLGVAGAIFVSTPSYYQSTGLLVLTTPPGGAVLETDPARKTTLNPLLAFDDGLKITATLLIQNLNSPTIVGELTTSSSGDSFTVTNGQLEGPFIAVKAESRSPENAKTMVQRVLARARQELENRQTALHAPRETFINIGEVVTPTLPETQIGGKVRAALAAMVLGIAGGLTGAYGAESYLVRRRRKAEDAATAEGAVEPEETEKPAKKKYQEPPTEKIAPAPEPEEQQPSWEFAPAPRPTVVSNGNGNGNHVRPHSGGRWPAALKKAGDAPPSKQD